MIKCGDDVVMALFVTVIIHTPAEYVISTGSEGCSVLPHLDVRSFLTHMSVHPAVTSLTDLSPYQSEQ